MTEGRALRLFVAAPVPEAHRTAVGDSLATLRAELEGARWTTIPNQHVTLKFIGWTPHDGLAEIRAALRSVRGAGPVTLSLADLGAFPSTARARVLWVGVEDPGGLLASLAAEVERALEPLGYAPERRAFNPHLTLARWRTPVSLSGRLPERPWGRLSPFQVERFELFRSYLSPRGAIYRRLESFGLGPGEAGGRG